MTGKAQRSPEEEIKRLQEADAVYLEYKRLFGSRIAMGEVPPAPPPGWVPPPRPSKEGMAEALGTSSALGLLYVPILMWYGGWWGVALGLALVLLVAYEIERTQLRKRLKHWE